MRIRVESIGCRLNIGEMDALARQFAREGHRIVGPGERADLVVFNTCAVTQVASRKSRKIVRQLRRQLPLARLVVTGCYADLSPAETAALGVDLVVPNAEKDRLAELLAERDLIDAGESLAAPGVDDLGALPGLRTRAFVKVQDGCNSRCTFCIVTVARGDSRSRDLETLVAEVSDLVAAGYREIVLTGVHLGSYGHDRDQRHGLEELVRTLLAETDVPRIRLSSLEPWDLRPEFFGLWENSRLQPHLHLPLQSGCDSTLTRMARNTTQAGFAQLVSEARSAIPDLAVSTDVIAGFPGECDAEFQESFDFIASQGFSRLHVFRYSAREGTVAATIPDPVPDDEIARRGEQLHLLGAELESRFRSAFVGRELPVLWESAEPYADRHRWSGLTGNYLRVVTETAEDVDLRNRIDATRLQEMLPGALMGYCADSLPTDVEARRGDWPIETSLSTSSTFRGTRFPGLHAE